MREGRKQAKSRRQLRGNSGKVFLLLALVLLCLCLPVFALPAAGLTANTAGPVPLTTSREPDTAGTVPLRESRLTADTADLTRLTAANTAENSRSGELPVYFADWPGSYLSEALGSFFPYSEMFRLDRQNSLERGTAPQIQLLSDNQAQPILQNRGVSSQSATFVPLYRATLVIATDLSQIGQAVHSFAELFAQQKESSLGLFLEPEYLLAAFTQNKLSAATTAPWLQAMREANAADRLELYAGDDANHAWPLALLNGRNESLALPPYLILWDYQAAQLGQYGSGHDYVFHVPQEGSLYLDFGLFATGVEAVSQLNLRLPLKLESQLQATLLAYAYRLPGGQMPSAQETGERFLAYPAASEYLAAKRRVVEPGRFNVDLLRLEARFRREVLGQALWLPASAEEEHIFLIFLIPLFLIWIASLFYRLDAPVIRHPMGILIFWLGFAVLLHFAQVMYANSPDTEVLFYLRFVPYFGMVDSWFFTGVGLAFSRGVINSRGVRLAYGLSVLLYGLGIAFILNEFHGLSFTLNLYHQYQRMGPFFYLSALLASTQLLLGFYLLARSQIHLRKWVVYLPGLFLAVIFLANLLFYFQHGSQRDLNYDLLNTLAAASFLELALQLRLIPANTSYFRLFRYSPAKLRLLSEDLHHIYPAERDDLRPETREAIRSAIRQRQARAGEEKSAIKVPSSSDPALQFSISPLRGGYLIWEENLQDITRLHSELSKLTQVLEQQGHLLEREHSIHSQYLSMQIRRKLLHAIEASLEENMRSIQKCLEGIHQIQNDPARLRHELARLKIFVSQCKRKSNLLIRVDEMISFEEIQLILREALTDAETAGIHGFAMAQGEGQLAARNVLLLYDYLQGLLQASVDLIEPAFFITVQKTPRGAACQILYSSQSELDENFFTAPGEIASRLAESRVQLSVERDQKDNRVSLSFAEGEGA